MTRGPGPAFHDDRHAHHLRAGLPQRVHGGQHGVSRGRGVLHGQDPAAGHVRALDPALQAVRLLRLAHHERVQCACPEPRRRAAWRSRRDRRPGSGRRPRRKSRSAVSSSITRPASGAALAVQEHPAQVDVPARPLSRRQDHVAVDHRLRLDGAEQIVAVGHGSQAYRPPRGANHRAESVARDLRVMSRQWPRAGNVSRRREGGIAWIVARCSLMPAMCSPMALWPSTEPVSGTPSPGITPAWSSC